MAFIFAVTEHRKWKVLSALIVEDKMDFILIDPLGLIVAVGDVQHNERLLNTQLVNLPCAECGYLLMRIIKSKMKKGSKLLFKWGNKLNETIG